MITLEEIKQAQQRIRGVAARTPLIAYYPPPVKGSSGKGQANTRMHSQDDLDDVLTTIGITQGMDIVGTPRQLYFKPESFQPIGSFKLRGAYNKIASLSAEERARGVITYSSGNHAQGVAYAARAVGSPAVVVMPRNSPTIKMAATEALGAEIVLVGPGSTERMEKAEALAAEHGYVIIPPFNDAEIMAGQGTVGLEILEDLSDVDLVLVPVGGGGLLSGISAAVKLSGSRAKVIGVEPQLANDAQQSFRAGKIVQITPEQASSTLADGLRTQRIGPLNLENIRKFVDDIVTVSENEIRQAMRQMASNARLVAEPSGAVTFAAWLFHQTELPAGQKVVAVISGGNVEPELFARIITEASTV
jgi:threonine dehydratase